MFVIFVNFAICVFIVPCTCTSPLNSDITTKIPDIQEPTSPNGDETTKIPDIQELVEYELGPIRNSLKKIVDSLTNNDLKFELGEVLGSMKNKIERAIKAEREVKQAEREMKQLNEEKIRLILAQEEYERIVWMFGPRVYFDDIEALFKPRYQTFLEERQKQEQEHRAEYNKQKGVKEKYVPLYSTSSDWPSKDDPRAIRMRKYTDMWYWFFTNLQKEDEIQKILVEMESAFRRKQTPPIDDNTPLNTTMQDKFNVFIKKCSNAIGYVHEVASILIRTPDAYDLFKGKLKELNVFGPDIDPYIVPVLNAIVPFIDYDKKPAVFEND